MNELNKYQVVWTETGKKDLIDIVEFIANDSLSSARKTANKIKTKAQRLESIPARGRWVPELQNVGIYIYRELIAKLWRIVYRIEQKTVLVTAVLDSRRDLQSILIEKLLR